MKDGQKRGRPNGSRNIRVIPDFREEPDIEKLGRALITVALRIAENKQEKKYENSLIFRAKRDMIPVTKKQNMEEDQV